MTEPLGPALMIKGFKIFKNAISADDRRLLVHDLRLAVERAPLYRSYTPSGQPLSVRTTSMGRYGWYSDAAGYRYVTRHPNGTKWPAIPAPLLNLWGLLVSTDRAPDSCLLNYYSGTAKMGLHRDNDEVDFSWPVLSISLGDDALFRVGGMARGDATQSVWLSSGDVVVMGGDARRAYHGIDRIKFGTSRLLAHGGRINLTLRVAK
ncbi:alpha-ketoglutarate-dependent dioxygenase AlkB [Amylibacter marinus]|uniref:Alpha-ketoglutarate-dependent dioxygenase AlkB n=1 Tax=Amylibacter marinus TaxID=1475483 RepID=A0ABQ5VWB1_9RHOB|nr:alpha-ketoglutarate-dependent dioxygenase AlkB [Amylibacter marinus]GLQ35511.1 alpha-ketoglutarate-dependent dioxygenase AlkB [Amylibacter marinus]